MRITVYLSAALLLFLGIASGTHAASFVNQSVGSNLVRGYTSNPRSIISNISNPAASAMSLKDGESFTRFGLLTNIGVGTEYGQIDNIFDVIDQKAQAFSKGLTLDVPALPADPNDPAQVDQFITELKDSVEVAVKDLNDVLAAVGQDGYAKVFANGTLPVMPISHGSRVAGGVLTLDVSGSVTSKSVTLQDPIDLDYADIQNQLLAGLTTLDLGEGTVDTVADNFTVDNDSTLVTRAATLASFSLGYSRAVFRGDNGVLLAGVRGKLYRAGLARVATRLGGLTDAEKILQDILNAKFNYDSNFGIDLGLLWESRNYQAGVTVSDINEPEFSFPGMEGLEGMGYTPGTDIYNRLASQYVYTVERQFKFEAGVFTADRRWALNATYDANAIPDPFGDDYQWATVSGEYFTGSWIIPGLRAGYRANLAGEKIGYGALGLTLLKVLNIDMAMALKSVDIDNDTVPRGAMLNIGLHMPI